MGMFAWLARWLGPPPRPIPRALWCSTIERYPFLRVLGEQEKARLKTLCEAEDLELVKGAQESVPEFRTRVRDALKAKVAAAEGAE